MSKIKNFFLGKLNELLKYAKEIELKRIKSLPNVDIDKTLFLGEYSSFSITSPVKLLKIHKNVSTRKSCNFMIYPNASLIIHENVFFNNSCSINCLGSIEIGKDCIFGEGVKIYDHNHKYDYQTGELVIERLDYTIGSVKIGKNCWLGSNVTILNNVEIGDNVIIGANALIYKSVPSNSIVKSKSENLISENKINLH